MNQIIPGILENSWEKVEQRLAQIKTFTNIVHVDIIDGEFAGNQTFIDPEPFKKFSEELFLELHMMVVDPIKLVEPFGKAGFKRFLGHVEHMSSQEDFIKEAKKYGEAGLALDGPTHINAIKVPFEQLDSIMIYTSNRVGFSGPPLIEDRLDKIRHLKKLTNIPIEADGGISDKTILRARDAGATRFVTTSFLFSSNSPAGQYSHLTQLLK